MLNSIRKRKRAQKIPMIILVVTLAVGLVGSFALWSVPKITKQVTAQDSQDLEKILQERQEELQKHIDELKGEAADYQKELDKNPENVENMLNLANTRYELGYFYSLLNKKDESESQFKESMELYQKVLKKEAGNKEAVYRLAIAAFQTGDMKLAGENFEKAVKAYPENPEVLLNYGVYLMSSGDFKAAIGQFEKAKELEPEENLKNILDSYIKMAQNQIENKEGESTEKQQDNATEKK